MEPKNEGLSVDEMLPYVGEFKIYQKLLCFLTFCVTFGVAMQAIIAYFASLPVTWHCVTNSTSCLKNGTFPDTDNYRCGVPRAEWKYNAGRYYSIAVQYDVPCSGQWLVTAVSSTFFFGMGLGAIVIGWIADNYGRKKVITPSIAASLLLGLSAPFIPSIRVLIFIRFLTGFFYPGAIVQMWILLSETVGNRKRPVATAIPGGGISIGWIAISLKAYLLQDWRYLSIACTVPYLLLVIPVYFFVPESARWLHLKKRPDEAMNILRKIAKWNKMTIPKGIQLSAVPDAITVHRPKSNAMELFNTKRRAAQTSVQMFVWMATSLTCFGFAFAANDLGGSLYVNFALICLFGLPALSISTWMSSKFGRKVATIVPSVLSGLLCLAIAAIPNRGHWTIARVVLGCVGAMCGSTTFTTIYVWTPELYGTKMRSLGMGVMQVSARVGAILAPWLMIQLAVVAMWIPFVILGVLCCLTGALALILPERKEWS